MASRKKINPKINKTDSFKDIKSSEHTNTNNSQTPNKRKCVGDESNSVKYIRTSYGNLKDRSAHKEFAKRVGKKLSPERKYSHTKSLDENFAIKEEIEARKILKAKKVCKSSPPEKLIIKKKLKDCTGLICSFCKNSLDECACKPVSFRKSFQSTYNSSSLNKSLDHEKIVPVSSPKLETFGHSTSLPLPNVQQNNLSPKISNGIFSLQSVSCQKKKRRNRRQKQKQSHHENHIKQSPTSVKRENTELQHHNSSTQEKICTSQGVIVVVDTNILMGSLSVVQNLRTSMFFGKSMKIVVPYIVVQELDTLKAHKSSAQKAIRWFNSYLEDVDLCVVGQKHEHNLQADKRFGGENADDSILNCCLLYKERKEKIFLISDDLNLRNKAIIAEVKCFSATNLQRLMLGKSPQKISNVNKLCNSGKGVKLAVINSPSSCEINKGTYNSERQTADQVDTEKSIIKRLGGVLEYAMKDAYSEIWETIVLFKPPWSAVQILKCFEKHWIAVFIDKFPTRIRNIIVEIRQALEHHQQDQAAGRLLYLYSHFKTEPYKSIISTDNPPKTFIKECSNKAQVHPTGESRKENISNSIELYENKSIINEVDTSLVDNSQRFEVDQPIVDHEILNISTPVEEYVKQAIISIGTHSGEILNEMVEFLRQQQQHSISPFVMSEAKQKLEVLRSTLVSFGYLLLSIKDETNVESAAISLPPSLANFWSLAQKDVAPFSCDPDGLVAFLTSARGKEFLQRCLAEFERVVQFIDTIRAS